MSSYNKTHLERISKERGFVRDNLEKVMRLCDILRHFHQNELLRTSLALKGGTAINLTIFQMPRLSVDIDLDFTQNCSRDEMLRTRQMVNNGILAYMTNEGYSLKPCSKSPHTLDSWVYGYSNAGGNPDNIKIEVNYSDRCHAMPIEEKAINIDFLGNIKVRTLAPIELFASKLNALISRAALRDIYDVHRMIEANMFASAQERKLLRKTFVFYIAVGSSCKAEEVTLPLAHFAHIEALSFAQVRSQLLPVLSRDIRFDFEKVRSEVTAFLKEFLTFTTEEQSFIEHFNRREYRPDFLFEDDEIVQRVANHPMALWKCRSKE